MHVQSRIVPQKAQALKLLWLPADSWAEYITISMIAIREKYFPQERRVILNMVSEKSVA